MNQKMPLKLERLVNESYQGKVTEFVKDTQAYASKLRELHKEVYDRFDQLPTMHDPREHLHTLEKYWSPERVERLGEIGNAILDSDKEKKLLALAQKSLVYKYEGDVYAIPFSVRLSEAGSAANGGFIARTVSMVIPSLIRFSAPITALGALCGYVIAKKRDQEKNPFEELGMKLENAANRWLLGDTIRSADETHGKVVRMLKDNPGGRE
ncbi:hypothetical protein HYX13_02130 [Candidatus Woesearchaeota archaeon]|nr:hypothetical protein [Candidatus Woesearchaeota archaeon]